MKSFRQELWFSTPERLAFLNITQKVQEALRDSGVQEGLCLVNAMTLRWVAVLLLLLSGCAARGWSYVPPAGVSETQFRNTLEACRDESGMVRSREEQLRLEQHCMMDRGYQVERAG